MTLKILGKVACVTLCFALILIPFTLNSSAIVSTDNEPTVRNLGGYYVTDVYYADYSTLVKSTEYDTSHLYMPNPTFVDDIVYDYYVADTATGDVQYYVGMSFNDAPEQGEYNYVFGSQINLSYSYLSADIHTSRTKFTSEYFYYNLYGNTVGLAFYLTPVSYEDGEETLPERYNADVTIYGIAENGETVYMDVTRPVSLYTAYDLSPRLTDFVDTYSPLVMWLEIECNDAVPSMVIDGYFSPDYLEFATSLEFIDEPYVRIDVDYSDFNLLEWLGTAIDGFLTTTIFSIGEVNVTLGTIVSIPLTIMILVVFLRKFAGG